MKRMIIVVLLAIPTLAVSSTIEPSREQREIKVAEQAILWALIAANSKENQLICSTNFFACSDDRAELGLALIGARNSEVSLASLAGLLRYRIDAGLSEDYTCYALNKGKLFIKHLQKLNAANLAEQCKNEVLRAKKYQPNLLENVEPNNICSEQKTMVDEARSLISVIKTGQRCHPEDF